MGFLTAFARISLDMTVVTILILCLPGLPPFSTFGPITLPPAAEWTGPREPNEKLNLVDRLFEDKIKGPESFAVKDGVIYTGLIGGLIVKIDPSDLKMTPVAQIGETCEGQHEEYRCGRPLGMTFTRSGKLIVCDGVFGLYLVDLDVKDSTEEMRGRIIDNNTPDYVNYEPLLTVKDVLNGSTNLVMNSVVVAEDDDTVYITVSSTNFPLRDSMFEFLSDSSGRLLKLSLKTRQTEILAENINFANGIELDPAEEFLLICETGRGRILKYHLKGPKSGTIEALDAKLPGLPDNIKLNDQGNYYIGIPSPRIPGKPHIMEIVGPHNWIRKFLCRLISMVMLPAQTINKVLPNVITLKFEYWIGNLEPISHLAPPYGLVVELDGKTGEIVSSLHSTNGAVRFISEALVHDRWIYFGSPYTHYLARVPKRLRHANPQKTSAGVTLGVDEPGPIEETIGIPM